MGRAFTTVTHTANHIPPLPSVPFQISLSFIRWIEPRSNRKINYRIYIYLYKEKVIPFISIRCIYIYIHIYANAWFGPLAFQHPDVQCGIYSGLNRYQQWHRRSFRVHQTAKREKSSKKLSSIYQHRQGIKKEHTHTHTFIFICI